MAERDELTDGDLASLVQRRMRASPGFRARLIDLVRDTRDRERGPDRQRVRPPAFSLRNLFGGNDPAGETNVTAEYWDATLTSPRLRALFEEGKRLAAK